MLPSLPDITHIHDMTFQEAKSFLYRDDFNYILSVTDDQVMEDLKLLFSEQPIRMVQDGNVIRFTYREST